MMVTTTVKMSGSDDLIIRRRPAIGKKVRVHNLRKKSVIWSVHKLVSKECPAEYSVRV